jgi:hypothetical protein
MCCRGFPQSKNSVSRQFGIRVRTTRPAPLPTVNTCAKACHEGGSYWLVVANTVTAMRITWLQPWLHRRRERSTLTLAAVISRWPFTRRNRPDAICARPSLDSSRSDQQDMPIQRVMLSLSHHLDVSRATQYLQHELDCDGWHVACRHEHQLVVQLTRGGVATYGVSYECSPAVEKAIYHGNHAWTLTIIPLHGRDNLPAHQVAEIKAGLGELHG